MRLYGIIVDEGYGFDKAGIRAFVAADTPQQARKAFLAKHWGAWYATGRHIRATLVSREDTTPATIVAADWLPGGRFVS